MASSIFRHTGLKVLSLALAALMWLLVSGERIVERAMRIPLEFINLSAELEVVGEAPNVVDVRVRGSSGALSRITPGDLVAMLDLRSARQGQRLLTVTAADVRAPFGIEVVQVTPSGLAMKFERSSSKVVKIFPAVDGQPADGFVVASTTTEPAMVEIVGPQSAVESLVEAITEPVSIVGASTSVSEMVNVGVADPSVRLRQPMTALVTVDVAPAPVEWAVADVPVQIRNAGPGTEAVPPRVMVHVRGPRATMGFGADTFTATIDAAGLRTGQYELTVQVVPPAGIGIVRVDPAQLLVRVR